MLDRSALAFPNEPANYNWDREIVSFSALDGSDRVSCAISEEALWDHFDLRKPGRRTATAVFAANRKRIEYLAKRKFTRKQLEPDGSVLIRSSEIL